MVDTVRTERTPFDWALKVQLLKICSRAIHAAIM